MPVACVIMEVIWVGESLLIEKFSFMEVNQMDWGMKNRLARIIRPKTGHFFLM